MKPSLPVRSPAVLLIVLLTGLLSFNSCRVVLVDSYDAKIAEQIVETSKEVDRFYLTMLEHEDRSYAAYSDRYIDIEVELNSLLSKNAARKHNEDTKAICERTLTMWQEYKAKHKADGQISDANVKLNRTFMLDQLNALQQAENGKQ